jgi:hypothetical protein
MIPLVSIDELSLVSASYISSADQIASVESDETFLRREIFIVQNR